MWMDLFSLSSRSSAASDGGLAAAGAAGDQDEPVMLMGHLLEGLGELELLDGGDHGLQLAQDDRVAAALEKMFTRKRA